MTGLTGFVLVTGTDTGVGKTVVTAAVAAAAGAAGLKVAVIKPAQTGADPAYGEPFDVEVVHRLAAPAVAQTLAEYPQPLAPLSAARMAKRSPLDLDQTVAAIKERGSGHDLTIVEGAGGLLVPMGRSADGAVWTVADLAVLLDAPAVVVARAGLGTLNHTALTLEALQRRGIAGHLVIGAWPARTQLAHYTNLADLPGPLCGLLPDGAAEIEPGVFRRSARGWLAPTLYGDCDDPRELAYPAED